MAKKPLQDSYDSRRPSKRWPKGGKPEGYGGMPRPISKKPAPTDEPQGQEKK
jgi:hypothetical protein